MRILFLTQVLPYPLDAGPKIRAYYTLCHLARRHEVVLLSFCRESDTPQAVEQLRGICRSVYTVPIHRSTFGDVWHGARSLLSGEPFLISRDRSAAMQQAVRQTVRDAGPFDAIHADQLWMARYATLARSQARDPGEVRIVLDQHNAVFQIPSRMAQGEHNYLKRKLLGIEARKLAKYEVQTCGACDHVVFVSHQDQAALRLHGLPEAAPGRESVIPISVEPAHSEASLWKQGLQRVTFMGGLHWPPNAEGVQWFQGSVWNLVRAAVPEAIFTLIGHPPPSGLRLESGESLEVTGHLDDPNPYLNDTRVFVVPLRSGGGMRVKILDAWSRGLPVVSTTIGAEGLRAQHGENILLADHPQAFADAVTSLLQDHRLASSIGSAGRRTVETHYDWKRVYPLWDKVYGCGSSLSPLTHPT
jgi:glycosyltransferase involved in cell wall biosynthesis